MPYFKKLKLVAHNDAGACEQLEVDVHIDAAGEFYAWLPDYLMIAVDVEKIRIGGRGKKAEGQFKLTSATFSELERALQNALRKISQPTVTAEPVIRYNIESHVSFAVDAEGAIFPNAGFPGAEWPRNDPRFGNHHAAQPARGGYSLTIGAKAMLKTTTTYGDKSKVKYSPYYGVDGNHLGHDNPAELLNSWVSFSLPDNAREIPYTDEAALFFHNLLLGLANISRQIQEHTFEQENLLALIAKKAGVPMIGVVSQGVTN